MNLLDLTPVASAEAEEQDGHVIVIRPAPITRGLRKPLDWLVYLLASPRLRLDDVGSFCWRHMDGRRTAGEIAEALRSEFGESVEPAEERLGNFFQSLHREELVTFPELQTIGNLPTTDN